MTTHSGRHCGPTRRLVIVRHNQFAVFTRLARAFAREPDIRVVWDRRGKDRRQASVAADKDRRGDGDRRRDSSLTSGATDYLLLTSNEWPTYGGPARRSHEVSETSQGPEYRRLIAELDSDLDAAARSDLAVLLTGGEAEGRFTLAQCIHRRSSRHTRPFVIVDRETFTTSPVGEDRQYRTLLDASDGGSWFIEGIATWSWPQQSELVWLLERTSVRRPGEARPPVRVMAASGENLFDRVAADEFRTDLFYRLNTLHLMLPSGRLPS